MTTPSSIDPLVLRRCRDAMPGFEVRLLARTPSTQDRVREAARAGAGAGFCVVADEQSAGRGRQGRSWVTPPSTALLMSLLVDAADHATLIPLAAGLSVCDAALAFGAEVGVKWPNDVLAGNPPRKLAGVLAERVPAGVVLGIGTNLTVPSFPEGIPGVSLDTLTAAEVSRDAFLGELIAALARRLDALRRDGIDAIRDDWRMRAIGLGAEIRAETPNGSISGVATDIDDDGALLLDTTEGRIRLIAGDVHIAR